MNLRRHLLETATLVLAAVAIALVANTLASRERKLALPGGYPNATTVPKREAAGDPSAPEQAAMPQSSPVAAEQEAAGSSSKGDEPVRGATAGTPSAPPVTAGSAAHSPSKKTPGGLSLAPPSAGAMPAARPGPAAAPPRPAETAAPENLLSRYPPHPDTPYVEISGEEAARLFAAGVPFLDARRTRDYLEGHVAGARPVSVWESDVDQKVVALLGERDGSQPLVLYCSGGDCEDSHLLAQKLWGAGFNNNLVYRDGFPDWVKRGGAVRRGEAP